MLDTVLPFALFTRALITELQPGDTADRSLTYEVGLLVKVDEPLQNPLPLASLQHGEIIESDDFDNNHSSECLIYGDNVTNLSELLEIQHFHINNDLNLSLIGPCQSQPEQTRAWPIAMRVLRGFATQPARGASECA